MRILIVNGYSDTPTGREAFKKFVNIIKQAFEQMRSYEVKSNIYIILDKTNISQYIYIKDTQYDNKEAARLFDNVDLIFMDGDANLLPWSRSAHKFGLLFKQAKRCDKALFGAGFVFYMVIYYCATNYLQANVINGNGWGTKLNEIQNYDGSKLPFDAKFLDNETGDLYSYNSSMNAWLPIANTGLHYTKNASIVPIGKFVQNVKVYRGKIGIRDIYETYASTNHETICFVKKSYVQHWAMIGLPQKFLVNRKNAWDPHPVNVTHIGLVGPNYHSLADNEKGPCIIKQRNSFATLFHIDSKYPETATILSNFVHHYVLFIQVFHHFISRVTEG